MEAYKKAALHIHSLNESDRQWLLGKLPPHQLERILPMLDELKSLGIPQRQELIETVNELAVVQPAVDQSPPEEKEPPPEFVGQILPAAPEMLYFFLKNEPPAITAALLLAYDWPWRRAVLDAFDEIDRSAIQEAMEQMEEKLTEKASQTIVNALAEKLRHPPESLGGDETVAEEPGKPVRRWSIFRRRAWQR